MPERPQIIDVEVPEDAPRDTLRALVRMLVIALTCAAGLASTYVIPGLEKMRPYVPGEDSVPFGEWVGLEGEGFEPPQIGGYLGGTSGGVDEEAAAKQAGVSEELMAEAAAAAEDDGEDEDLIAPPPVIDPIGGAPDEPAEVGQPTTVHGKPTETDPARHTEPAEAAPEPPKVTVDPAEYEGITREIEDPTGKALDHFYRKLERTALRENDAITRITHWGASVIGADGMTSVARRKLQKRFGSAGKGWVNIAPGWKWYKQRDVVFEPRAWKDRTVTRDALGDSHFGRGRYGYGGVAGIGWGARSTYKAYAKRMELYYLEYPRGGDIEVTIDDGEPIKFSTRADEERDAFRVFEVDEAGEHTFEVRAAGGGNVHAYGVTLELDGPGVVYDCIGLIGTRASRILNYDPEHLEQQVAHRAPDLQIIMFGGNELVDRKMNLRLYEEKYEEVVRRLRAGRPEASCVMMTPVDHGELHRGRVRTVPLLQRMIPIQQAIAERVGCAFFNTYEAMGGEGSIGRWYRAEPRLAWGDFAHLTRAGDRVLGAMIYKAIMKGFADWLKKPRAARP